MTILIKKATHPNEIQQCLNIRKQVFIDGQNVPLDEEVDGKDNESVHYLLLVDQEPVGVSRVRFIGDYAKIERVGILDAYQGRGLGKEIMLKILEDLHENQDVRAAKLCSQTHAIPFYEKLGFVVCSEEYMDAGLLHRDMKLVL